MKTQKVNTRFMEGNKDVEGLVFDILVENYGQKSVYEMNIDLDEAIFSNGFINAIENGLIPTLEVKPNFMAKGENEYHHFIINNECFVMYFNNRGQPKP